MLKPLSARWHFLQRLLGRFARHREAIAATEFALILPFLFVALLGIGEATAALSSYRRVSMLGNGIGQMMSQLNRSFTNSDWHYLYDTALVTMPQLNDDATVRGNSWWQNIDIGMTSIAFRATPTGCTSNCTYTPYVVWSMGSYNGNQVARSCGTPTIVSNGTKPTPSTIPAGVVSADPIIAVDIVYTFRPRVSSMFFGSFSISDTSFYVMRNSIRLEIAANSYVSQCPGT